ncbi:MAG TPA: tellurite resistance/C4-dicarboxylate transporter family protein [Streptosporangiaceae bacterium]
MPGTSRPDRLREAARTLDPGYFALVMASGIVSVAMHDDRAYLISVALLWIAAAGYAALVLLTGWRLVAFRSAVAADLADPARGFTFLTFVAGTNVLGVRLAGDGHSLAAAILLCAGGVGWLVLGYLVPWTAVLGRPGGPAVSSANGTWFLWAVAAQSVAVLAAVLEPAARAQGRALALLAVLAWAVGIVLYAAAGMAVAARLLRYEVHPTHLTQPYWVSMGATAITVVAGAKIAQMTPQPAGSAVSGVIGGISLIFWAFGTWLIPALVAAGWWRHVRHGEGFRYEPAWWSVVFPVGMYGVACYGLGQQEHLPIVRSVGTAESWVALAVWAAAFLGMVLHLLRAARRQPG